MNFLVDKEGYYGEFGGAYVPEILHKCVEELQNTYLKVLQSEDFKREYDQLLRDYVGRPSPLYLAHRLSEKYGCRIYLKREDLNHTGAHKINNSIGQVLLARRMGKRRIIAETGAGQHGVATATVCALMNMECIVYIEGRHQRSHPRLVLPSGGHLLRDRFHRGPASLPRHGGTPAVRHQRRNKEAAP
mgnify:CR=1 FL=1